MNWGRAGLWAAFALLLIVGGGQFLFACGMNLGALMLNYCPARPDASSLRREFERGRELERMIHLAELKLAEKPNCQPPAPSPPPPSPPPPKHLDIIERHGEHGKVEILLTWRGHDDLDLIVYCPNDGRIGGRDGRPGSCGEGVADIDANRNAKPPFYDPPAEHARWKTEVPDGELKVEAFLFVVTEDKVGMRVTLPFDMTFTLDGQSKTCSGSSYWIPFAANQKTSDNRRLATRNAYMAWTPSNGLPDSCNWSFEEGHYCSSSESCDKR